MLSFGYAVLLLNVLKLHINKGNEYNASHCIYFLLQNKIVVHNYHRFVCTDIFYLNGNLIFQIQYQHQYAIF